MIFPLYTACFGSCAATYALLTAMVSVQARRNLTSWILAFASVMTATWAVASLSWGRAHPWWVQVADVLHALAWYAVVLRLHLVAVSDRRQFRLFLVAGSGMLVVALWLMLASNQLGNTRLLSSSILLQIMLAVGQLVLLENLFREAPVDYRWYVGLACVALAGQAAYDLFLSADAVLTQSLPVSLVAGRAVVAVLIAPLLAIASMRNQSWGVRLHASRTAVFHTATLVGSGILLLSLAGVAEAFRGERWVGNSDWAQLIEVSVLFSAVLGIAVFLVSTSTRNRLARLLTEHFFTCRYDYRREWLRCIGSLSAGENGSESLAQRAIRSVADIVDSPAGMLLSRQPGQIALTWSESWNLPAIHPLGPDHPLVGAISGGQSIEIPAEAALAPLDALKLWLAIPLLDRAGRLTDCILLGPPRMPFRLDEEVWALVGVVAREVAMHLAEQRATRSVIETQDLRVYAERFAFVAHDIKNVAGQLRLLTDNASRHIANPDFQQDMLETINASVAKIGNLIRRLGTEDVEAIPGAESPIMDCIASVLQRRERVRLLASEGDETSARISMSATDLDAVLTHLLDNACTAAGPNGDVALQLQHKDGCVLLDIIDEGPGMTPEFIRDELFRPFSSGTPGGSGIGAYQARELMRHAGGDLVVLSRPTKGTTMRLFFPVAKSERLPVAASAPVLA